MSTSATTPIMTAETETIPEDVMKAARNHVAEAMSEWKREFVADGSYDHHPGVQTCARAILAERARCETVCVDRSKQHQKARHSYEDEASQAGCLSDAIEALACAQAIRNPTP